MGACRLCGQKAGILQGVHRECEGRRARAIAEITQLAAHSAAASVTPHLEETLVKARGEFVEPTDARQALVQGWSQAVSTKLESGLPSKQEERALIGYAEHFGLRQPELDGAGNYTRLMQALVLRELTEGTIPTRFKVANQLPLNLQAGETVVWAFNNTEYRKEETFRAYTGRSRGMSIRVARGLYYRVGSFMGMPMVSKEIRLQDIGPLVITSRHLYFIGLGRHHSFRVPLRKIVAFEPFADGVGFTRDNQSAKPEFFMTGDGWFLYNLLTNLGPLAN